MRAHTGKTQTNEDKATTRHSSKKKIGDNARFQLTGNHPDAIARREFKEAINRSVHVKKQEAFQDTIDTSPHMTLQRRSKGKVERQSGKIGHATAQLSAWRFLGGLIGPKGYRWGKRKDARNAARRLMRNAAPLAPVPFRRANFAFASKHGGTIGSLYFDNAGTHQRMRLTHRNGPQIGAAHANAVWYFPKGKTWPKRAGGRPNKNKAVINEWLTGPPAIPAVPTTGRNLVEFHGGNAIRFAGSHPSRGTVAKPSIKQTDLNVIYQAIASGADNATLRQRILDYGLSRALRQ